nr:MAG TPA: hypothetical protein [Caudoviricetes sp.]
MLFVHIGQISGIYFYININNCHPLKTTQKNG